MVRIALAGVRLTGNDDSIGRLSVDYSWGIGLPFPA